MSEGSVYLPVKKATAFMLDALSKMGVPQDDARIVADALLASDLRGVRSHGIAHLKMYHERMKKGLQQAVTNWKIVQDGPTTAVVDGGNGMGMVVGYHSMKLAMEKARKLGLGAVAVRNSSHYGIAGFYTELASKEGMVGMSVTNAHPSIAPTFGVEPMSGTNPIAFSAPTDEEFDFTFDAATSIAPRGKLELAARAGKPIPAGWVIKEDGSLATDSAGLIAEMDASRAALLPLGGAGEQMGGHKGYGLATIVEILSASFQDGAFLSELHDHDHAGNVHPLRIGHFFLAINIESFLPAERFRNTTGKIVRELRDSKKAAGEGRIYTAGEKCFYNSAKVMREGIEIPPGLQKNLAALRTELNITGHDLGF